MRAIVQSVYGAPETLRAVEVPTPVPGRGEVLVRVRAVALNASDVELLTGRPAYVRIWGLLRSGQRILGSDVSGVIESIGTDVSDFALGEEVLADNLEGWGGLAEYVRLPATALVRKPTELSFSEAAAIPQAGTVALQALRAGRAVQAGERVLVNGAGGGAGSFAIQLARQAGAEVTAVDSADKLAAMRALGAHQVVDYVASDYTQSGEQYDRIIDLVGPHSVFANRRALRPKGRYLLVGGSVPRLLQAALCGPCLRSAGRRLAVFAHQQTPSDIAELATRVVEGSLRVVIDREYPLVEAAAAFARLEARAAVGKLVLLP